MMISAEAVSMCRPAHVRSAATTGSGDRLARPQGDTGSSSSSIQPCLPPAQLAQQQRRPYLLVVVDDNMYYRSMRYKCYQLARKCEGAELMVGVHM